MRLRRLRRKSLINGASPLRDQRFRRSQASETAVTGPGIDQAFRGGARPEMHVRDSQVVGESFVDTVKPEDTWSREIATSIEIPMLTDRPARDDGAGHTPDALLTSGLIAAADDGLDHMPFPGQVWRGFSLGGVFGKPLRDECADGDRRQEANPNHPFPNGGHELRRQLIGDLIEPKWVERALARSGRIGGGQEGKCDRHQSPMGYDPSTFCSGSGSTTIKTPSRLSAGFSFSTAARNSLGRSCLFSNW